MESDTSDDIIARSHRNLEARVRSRAHQIYLRRQGGSGSDIEDWLEAERQILGNAKQQAQDRATVIGPAGRPRRVFSGLEEDERAA